MHVSIANDNANEVDKCISKVRNRAFRLVAILQLKTVANSFDPRSLSDCCLSVVIMFVYGRSSSNLNCKVLISKR